MRHLLFRTALVLLTVACSGCDHAPAAALTPSPVPQTPAATPPAPVPYPVVNWLADATVVAVTRGDGGPCGWGTSPGETRKDVYWRIDMRGDAIELDEDLPNWPTDDILYKGTLKGTHFTATYSQGDDYLLYVCRFRGATITGDFSSDFSTFEAEETLGWGTPDDGTTVRRHWTGRFVGK